MRRLVWILLVFTLAAASAHASVCDQASSGNKTVRPHWRIDHYVHDASLDRDWEVLVNCDDPGAPARMKLAPKGVHPQVRNASGDVNTARGAQQAKTTTGVADPQPPVVIRAGTAVEVTSPPDDPVRILLSGTAVEAGRMGRMVRVRIRASGHFLSGIVRGPHTVELAAARPVWGKP